MTNSDLPVQWFIITLSLMCIITVITCFVSLYTFYQLIHESNYNEKKSIRPLFRNLTMISMISFCMTNIMDIIHIYLHMMEEKSFSLPIEPKISGIADTFYYIGSISFYSLLLCRIHFVFKDTTFRLSKITLFIICAMILISGLAAIWYILIIVFFYHNWKQWVNRGMPATYLLSCNDFLLNIVLFILFYYKLKQTIMNIEKLHRRPTINNISSGLFTVMTKHSVLFSLAIITNQFFFVGVMLMAFTDLGHEHFTDGLIMILILRSIENTVNIFALWLILKNNKMIYYKCCGICHKCVENICKEINTKHLTFDDTAPLGSAFLVSSQY